MTVKQLIEELEKCAPDKEVLGWSEGIADYEPIISVTECKKHVEISW